MRKNPFSIAPTISARRPGFSDGEERIVDLSPLPWGPVFEEIAEDDEAFNAVRVDPRSGRCLGRTEPTWRWKYCMATASPRSDPGR